MTVAPIGPGTGPDEHAVVAVTERNNERIAEAAIVIEVGRKHVLMCKGIIELARDLEKVDVSAAYSTHLDWQVAYLEYWKKYCAKSETTGEI